MAEQSIIETGVDKLVELVKARKRISVPDAAKLLNVSKVVVEEWADFLEEEGIISIEYKFTTPYLVERTMSKKEVEDKVKDFCGKREGFIRKAEVTLSLLDNKGDVLKNIKDDFKELKDELGQDLGAVQEEFKLLDKYHQEKRNVDTEIRQQETEFKQRIHEMESQITKERERFREVLEDIKKEQQALDKERIHALSVKEIVKVLESTVGKFDRTVASIRKNLVGEEHSIENTEQHLSRLKSMGDAARKDLEQKRSQMSQLLAKSEQQQQRILSVQKKIVQKASKPTKASKTKGPKGAAAEKVKRFFAHNKEIEEYLTRVNVEKDRLGRELGELIRKAKAFHLISKSQDIKSYVADLSKRFKQIEKDRSAFEGEVGKLKSLMKG